jgi:hypothetical protein
MGDIGTLKKLLLDDDLDAFINSIKGLDLHYVNETEFEGFTIMQTAVNENQKKFVDALLDFKVDANYGTGKKKPVLLAAKYGYCTILESFLDRKWNVDFDVHTEDVIVKRDELGTISGHENVLHLGK